MALEFAQFVGRVRASGDCYPFGMDQSGTAAALRSLADAIDAKEALVQCGRILCNASAEEFATTTLRLTVVERVPPRLQFLNLNL